MKWSQCYLLISDLQMGCIQLTKLIVNRPTWFSRGRINMKKPSYQCRNSHYSHYKDEMVSWHFYLYNGSPYTWKDGHYIETGTWLTSLILRGPIHTLFWIYLGVEWTRFEQRTIMGHSLKTVSAVSNPGECQSLCLVTSGCLSINYVQRGDKECSLNSCTRLDAGSGYIRKAIVDYYEYHFTPLGKCLWML